MDVSDEDRVEILVHISAPSKGSDDAAYRALVTAYLAYEPRRRELDHQSQSLQNDQSPIPNSSMHEPASSSIGDAPYIPSLSESTPTSQFSAFKSPDASFKSITDNIDTPKFYGLTARRHVSHQTSPAKDVEEDSWQFPPSIVPDSQLGLVRSMTATSSPVTAFQMYLDCLCPTASNPDSRLRPEASAVNSVVASSIPNHLPNTLEEPQSSLELPKLPRKGRHLFQPEKGQARSSATPAPTPIILPISSLPAEKPAQKREFSTGLPEPPRKRQRRTEPESNQAKAAAEAKKFPPPPPKAAPRSKQSPTVTTPANPDEIRPPLPQTSLSSLSLSDIITPRLAEIGSNRAIAKSWRDDLATRALRSFERGYWLANYSTWDAGLRSRSWAFLTAWVGKGLAGWGVWCTRAPERSELRLYCWGGIARHAFFLLYVVSERRLKGCGATWFDGDGVPVIVVPGREARETAGGPG